MPSLVAERACEVSKSCLGAAEKTEKALRVLGYKPELQTGYYKPRLEGGVYHAWVEYIEDGQHIVLDPEALLGWVEKYRNDVKLGYYIAKETVHFEENK